MKVNIFISLVKSASAWLHGEGGKHFRTYTYPKIKSITRKFINLGIYERFEHLYRIVDDTFYNGAVEEDVQMPQEVFEAERLAEQMEKTEGALPSSLPRFEDIKDGLVIYQSLEQQRTYRCVTFTVNNMLRTAMIQKGLKPIDEVTAIDPLYLATKVGPGKTGTNSSYIMEYLGREGYPLPSWTPRMQDHNKELAALESDKNIDNALKFTARVTTGNFKWTRSFDEAVQLDKTLPANWIMQCSINFSASLKWFGQRVPYLVKKGDSYSLTRTGGHSVHAVRHSFSTGEDGVEGFAIIDSAYRSSEDGFRFATRKLMDLGILKVRFVEFNLDGETVAPPVVTPTPTPAPTNPGNDDSILSSADISYGDKGENVKALQRFLIAEGYNIPAGPTGNFGPQTKSALKAWQDITFGPKYTGEYWGSISRAKYIQLKQLG